MFFTGESPSSSFEGLILWADDGKRLVVHRPLQKRRGGGGGGRKEEEEEESPGESCSLLFLYPRMTILVVFCLLWGGLFSFYRRWMDVQDVFHQK